MQKTIDDAINETANRLAEVINTSGLPLSVLKLMLTNTLMSLQRIQMVQPAAPTEESENAENES